MLAAAVGASFWEIPSNAIELGQLPKTSALSQPQRREFTSNSLHSRKGRFLPLQEYPGRGTHGELQGTRLVLWLLLTVWCMRNLLSWDCIRGREMRSWGGTQTSWGKTPTLALLTNPAYVILLQSITFFCLICLLEFVLEELRVTQISFLWLKSCLDFNEPNQAWCYQMLRNKELSWCLLGTGSQRKAQHGPGRSKLGEDLLGSLQQRYMRAI